MISEPFLILDAIGVACAVRVFVAWLRQQGLNPLLWRGTAIHAVDCTFCLPFWCSLPVMLWTHQTPLHAFGIAAIGYAFFETFLPPASLPMAEIMQAEKAEEADWNARDVLPKAETSTIKPSPGNTTGTLKPVTYSAPVTGVFIFDDAKSEIDA